MLRAVLLAGTATFLAAGAATAQSSLLQSGPNTPGHVPQYVGQGISQPVVQDGGGSGGGGFGANPGEIGITARSPNNVYPSANSGHGPLSEHACVYDAPTTNATGYHYFCLDPNAAGGGLLHYGAGGTAASLPFTFVVNGASYTFPFTNSGALGPNTTTVGHLATWGNTTGTLLADVPSGFSIIPSIVPDWNYATQTGTDNCSAITAAVGSAVGKLYIPPHTYLNCAVTLKTRVELVGRSPQTSLITAGFDYSANADLILGPSGAILSGDLTSGWPSGMDGLLIVRSNWVKPTTLRQAYDAARSFAGTALTIQTPNFHGSNLTFIGFNIPILNTETSNGSGVNADQTILENIYGDNTNGIVFAATNPGVTACCGDIPHIRNVHLWPGTNYNPAWAFFESTEVSNVTNSGGAFLVTLAGLPATTPYRTGDIIEIGPITGMPTINKQWVITVVDSTHFTLNGSTFAGVYGASVGGACATKSPGCNLSYFNGNIRTGRGLSVEDANTAIDIVSYFVQSYNTAYYYGHGSFTVNCVNCYDEFQPEQAADASSIGVDVESNADNISHIGGQILGGTGLKLNTSNPHAMNMAGVYLGGFVKVIDAVTGNLNITGGSLGGGSVWPPAGPNAAINVASGATICTVGANVVSSVSGTIANYRCPASTAGMTILTGTTDGGGNATIALPAGYESTHVIVGAGFAVAASLAHDAAMIVGPSSDAGNMHIDNGNLYIVSSSQHGASVRAWVRYTEINDANWP